MALPSGIRRRTWHGDLPRRVATLSVHTSPLDQPGVGDAGGMNVWIDEVSRRIAAMGIEVDIFTRATRAGLPPVAQVADGVTVRHIVAGPLQDLPKDALPAQLCAFTSGLFADGIRAGSYDVVHSHYWLSGHVGWLAKENWGVPLVHSMHTMAKVKNAALADGDSPEPTERMIGEEQVVAAADRLVASTHDEARELIDLYDADPDQVVTIAPGVDLDRFRPGDPRAARRRLGLAADAVVLLFVGRIQPLKAPDVLLRAAAEMLARDPSLRDRLTVLIVGGASGSGTGRPNWLAALAAELAIADRVRLMAPVTPDDLAEIYRAATVTVVPSYNESFGLVALESQACGTPVVAAEVGGLRTAVVDGVSGALVSGHDPLAYARVLADITSRPAELVHLSHGAIAHANAFSWSVTAARVVDTYRDAITAATLSAVSAG
ncbi:MAG: D-inositol-3-phosphate glycosyltransferase [Frankiaceae bacterium]|nr:D-inositol-3-phosphate glycosyltransferase [Frankiaceae bacterium]